jgi:hypothetical protein
LQAQQASEARSCAEKHLQQVLNYLLHPKDSVNIRKADNGDKSDFHSALTDVTVVYYSKLADDNRVTIALNNANVSYSLGLSSKSQENPTVAISCTNDVPAMAIRELALILKKNGVSIRLIDRITNPAKRNRLEILSYVFDYGAGLLKSNELSDAQINSISSCPAALSNPATQTFNVRATNMLATAIAPGYTNTPEETSQWFCEYEGLSKNIKYNLNRISGDVEYVKTGERGFYCNDCIVFDSIECGGDVTN